MKLTKGLHQTSKLLITRPFTVAALAQRTKVTPATAARRVKALRAALRQSPNGVFATKVRQGERGPKARAFYIAPRQ